MRSIDWEILPLVIVQILLGLLTLTFVYTFFGTLVMKLFARAVPLRRLAIVCFWAIFRVFLVVAVIMAIVIIGGINVPQGLSGLFAVAGMSMVGWLITHDLQRDGIPKKFPGVGFKVVVALLVLSWIVGGLFDLAGAEQLGARVGREKPGIDSIRQIADFAVLRG